jgi:hypothetical protein
MYGRLLTIAISLIPIWWFRYFATQDGPAHVYNAAVTRWIGEGTRAGVLFESGFNAAGNAATHALLWFLLAFTGPETAWKLITSLCVIGLWLGFWRVLRAFGVIGLTPSLLLAPAVYSFLLHMGFSNFLLGAALAMWVMAWAVEWRGGLTWRRTAALSGMLTLIYLCHAMMWLLALGWCLAWAGRRLWMAAAAGVPGAAMLGAYASTALSAADVGGPVPGMAIGDRLISVVALESLHCFSRSEIAVNVFGAILFWGALAYVVSRKKRIASHDALLAVALAMLLARMSGPNDLRSGAYLWVREHWLFLAVALLWIAVETNQRRRGTILAVLCSTWALALCLARWPVMRDAEAYIDEYRRIAGRLEPDRITLTMTELRDERFNGIGILHQGYGYLLEARPLVVNDYEAMNDHFTVRFREGKNSLGTAGFLRGSVQEMNTRVSIAAYEQRTGVRVEQLVLWGDARPKEIGEFEEIARIGRVGVLKRKGRPAGEPSSLN